MRDRIVEIFKELDLDIPKKVLSESENYAYHSNQCQGPATALTSNA